MSQECCNAVLHKKSPLNESFAFSQFFLYIIIIDSIGSLVSVNYDSVVICSGLRDGRYFIYDYYHVPKHSYYILLYIIIITL